MTNLNRYSIFVYFTTLISLIGLIGCATSPSLATASDPDSEGDGDYVVGPEFPIDPDLTDKGNPRGKLFTFGMRLADSRIFKGNDATLEPEKPVVLSGTAGIAAVLVEQPEILEQPVGLVEPLL